MWGNDLLTKIKSGPILPNVYRIVAFHDIHRNICYSPPEVDSLLGFRQLGRDASYGSEYNFSRRNIITNAEQFLACKIIKSGHNLILTGQAGSGKTYAIQNTCKQLLNPQ